MYLGCKRFSYKKSSVCNVNSRGGDLGQAWTSRLGSSRMIDSKEKGVAVYIQAQWGWRMILNGGRVRILAAWWSNKPLAQKASHNILICGLIRQE